MTELISKPENFNITELIAHLQGTCKSLDEGINDIYPDCDSTILTDEDHATIDNEIFLCADCGWWYEVCEKSECEDEDVCNDCNEDRNS